MKSFIDAMYYSFNVSTTLGYGDVTPDSFGMKLATMIQNLLIFLSVTEFAFLSGSSLINKAIFVFVNSIIIIGMTFLYKYTASSHIGKTFFDQLYFATITHTTVGFGDHKKPLPDSAKLSITAHIILVFILINSYNSGIFSILLKAAFPPRKVIVKGKI
jgi:hypothetical protein